MTELFEQRFKSGWTPVESDQRSGKLQTTRNVAIVEKVENLIVKYRRLTLQETTKQIERSTVSPLAILWDHMQRGCEICSQASVGGTERITFCNYTGPTGNY
ncbi:hypothetical protein TNCV_796451 [Trichonephila clavipes]|uniref:Uncharacterized protein n=1 Tax=Trichonephila clavipes TaxID=2585209 RepID=A0A8X6WIA0_TRICX|nr:hypothetical protein TNCV_796451 [Trichonephila clavipes]